MTYAEGTDVSVEKSRAELDALLRKHGANQRVFADDDQKGVAIVCFSFAPRVEVAGVQEERRQYRLEIPLPKWSVFQNQEVRGRDVGRLGPDGVRRRRHEQACRERWRAICLLVKAKLELIALGASSVEREFLADLVLADGSTVHAQIADRIREAYQSGEVRPLLGMGGT